MGGGSGGTGSLECLMERDVSVAERPPLILAYQWSSCHLTAEPKKRGGVPFNIVP